MRRDETGVGVRGEGWALTEKGEKQQQTLSSNDLISDSFSFHIQ